MYWVTNIDLLVAQNIFPKTSGTPIINAPKKNPPEITEKSVGLYLNSFSITNFLNELMFFLYLHYIFYYNLSKKYICTLY